MRARLRGGTPQLIVGAEARSAPEPSVSKRSNASRISCFCSSVSACLALAAGRFAGGMRTGKAANCSTCVRGRNSYHWMRSTPIDDSEVLLECRADSVCVPSVPKQAPRCLLSQKGIPPLPASGPIPLTPRQPRQQVSASANPSARPNPSDAAPTAPTFSAHTMALFAHKKIIKEKGAEPEAFEVDVAQAICDLEANSNDLKAELHELYIVSAKEVDVAGRKAVVIFVPFKLLKVVHKIQSRLVREVRARPLDAGRRRPALAHPAADSAPLPPRVQLEKKFSGKHVVIIGQRRIMRKPSAGQRQPRQKRPRSRTLTAVHEAILEDLVRRREPPCRSVPRPMPHAPPAATRAACALADDRYTRPRSSGSTRATGWTARRSSRCTSTRRRPPTSSTRSRRSGRCTKS